VVPARELTSARRALLELVAARVPARSDCGVRVAVDGVDGAGKTVFADELADVLLAAGRSAVRVTVDAFHQPRAVHHRRGRDSPEGFWLDSYDYSALQDRVLRPFGPGGSLRYRAACHDLASDQRQDPPVHEATPGTIVVLDGVFLHREELAGCKDLSVFLHVPFAVSVPRMAGRDGSHPDPDHPSVARYVKGQQIYLDLCQPWDRADLVIDGPTWMPRPCAVPADEARPQHAAG